MTNNEIAKKLIELGGNEWEKGDHHRVYIDGIDAKRFFDSEHAKFGKAHKVFFDVRSGEFKSPSKSVAENLNCLLDEMRAA